MKIGEKILRDFKKLTPKQQSKMLEAWLWALGQLFIERQPPKDSNLWRN